MSLFQTHGRPSILQITCYTGVLAYAEMKLLDRKLRGILQLMTELSVEIIQILDLQSWLYTLYWLNKYLLNTYMTKTALNTGETGIDKTKTLLSKILEEWGGGPIHWHWCQNYREIGSKQIITGVFFQLMISSRTKIKSEWFWIQTYNKCRLLRHPSSPPKKE